MKQEVEQKEKPAFDLMDSNNYNLSEFDLILHPKIKNVHTVHPRVLEGVLWECGMDIRSHAFKIVTVPHRTLQGQHKNGLLYCGRERTDHSWAKSGMATMAGQIEGVWDKELQNDMRRISRS